ncbi:hypothetical protein PF011_g21737 [Phytophthora fragariae]|uniref:Uncharacterized protein n=1 Tax=Phytophthora fragariae TaxID=53985 RepID=A0A6A3IG90_9STRA|nr:hypothetical protein PF003_g36810 [Phytophthora fragariae]KAE8982149.1 hypothetical protein PF011_g21737 [Phytophthora fragariae]
MPTPALVVPYAAPRSNSSSSSSRKSDRLDPRNSTRSQGGGAEKQSSYELAKTKAEATPMKPKNQKEMCCFHDVSYCW